MIAQQSLRAAAAIAFSVALASAQNANRMEITLERLDGATWHAVDPGLVLAQGDRVRFRFHTNFDGYLYMIDHGTSGKQDQLFPHAQTGQDNHVIASKEYQIPATSDTVFRIAGPAGHDIVYFMVSPTKFGMTSYPGPMAPKPGLIPRCDESLLRARGDCIDSSAGVKPDDRARDLVFMREGQQSVISSPTPLAGPVIYQFHLAHK